MIHSGLLSHGPAGAARWFLTDRHGGAGLFPYDTFNLSFNVADDRATVHLNRGIVIDELRGHGVDQGLAFMQAEHGRRAAVVAPSTITALDYSEHGAPDHGVVDVPGVDVLITQTPGLAIAALSADCVPSVLADMTAGVLAAVHAGWRGVSMDAIGAALDEMERLGARAQDTVALVGPAICGECYEVGPEVVEAVSDPEATSTTFRGSQGVDLRRSVKSRLADRGVTLMRYPVECTAESEDLFSHRAEGETGRQAAIVVFTPEALEGA